AQQRAAGDQRPTELEQQEAELVPVGRNDGQDGSADKVEGEIRPRRGRHPTLLGADERGQDEQRAGYLNELVHDQPPSRRRRTGYGANSRPDDHQGSDRLASVAQAANRSASSLTTMVGQLLSESAPTRRSPTGTSFEADDGSRTRDLRLGKNRPE